MDKQNLEITLLLEAILILSGFDFRRYNRNSIKRRIEHRVKLDKLESISRLTESIIYDEKLLNQVLADFSINVTEMFRDPKFFRIFLEEVLPTLYKIEKIRIWHAGCSTGEEPYSMAILLDELGLLDRTLIFATDMNEAVLDRAKEGRLPINKIDKYANNYLHAGGKYDLSKYYTIDDNTAILHPYLRNSIVFAQHNLVTDSSFQEFDIIICRNVLIYFNFDLQEEIHQLFYESLRVGGFLGLGNKETIQFTSFEEKYEVINRYEHIYKKVKKVT